MNTLFGVFWSDRGERQCSQARQAPDAKRGIIRTHAAIGADLLGNSNIPQMEMAEQIARHDYDWRDGSNGCSHSGDLCRVVAIAEVFDALTHDRPHHGAWPIEEALREIVRLP